VYSVRKPIKESEQTVRNSAVRLDSTKSALRTCKVLYHKISV